MTWALLAFSASALGAVVTISLLLHKQHGQTRIASDTANEWRRKHDEAANELRLQEMATKAKTAELAIVTEQLVTAQQQLKEAGKFYVEQLKNANADDAAKALASLVAVDLRAGVLREGRPLSEDPADGLENPNL